MKNDMEKMNIKGIINKALENCNNNRTVFFDEVTKLSKEYFKNYSDEEIIKANQELFNEIEILTKPLTYKRHISKLNELYNFADSSIKRKIKNLLINILTYSEKDVIKQIDDLEDKISYTILHENHLSNQLISDIHSKNKMNELCILDTFGNNAKFKTKDLEYTIENFKYYRNQFSYTTSRLFVVAIRFLSPYSNISKFTFTEYVDLTGVTNHTENREKLKNDLEILKNIGNNLKYESKKKKIMALSTLIIDGFYKNGDIIIEWNEKFVEGLRNTYMYIPKNLLQLKGKSLILAYYIFVQLRTNFKTKLNLSINSCLRKLAFPGCFEEYNPNKELELKVSIPQNIKKSRYQQHLMTPFEEIIDNLSKSIPELYIEFDRDYKNLEEFLNSNINIELKNPTIVEKYNTQKVKKNKKNIQYNSSQKIKNLELTKKYRSEGLSTLEISKKLNVSSRTVRNYYKELYNK